MNEKNKYEAEAKRIAESVASAMDGRTVTSHEHWREMLAAELRSHILNLIEKIKK